MVFCQSTNASIFRLFIYWWSRTGCPWNNNSKCDVCKKSYSYWRSKKVTSTFNTTSTSNGSALDFTPLSKKNEKIIIDYTKKLNVSIAAYDVTFENDDTESKPIILEVSTSFLLNPIPTGRFLNQPYLKYKASPIKFARDRSKMFLDFKFNVLKKFINES